MSKKKIGWRIVFLLFLIIATVNIVLQQRNTPYQHDEGQVFGTYYHITYQNDTSLNDDIMAELMKVDEALSMFNKNTHQPWRERRNQQYVQPRVQVG